MNVGLDAGTISIIRVNEMRKLLFNYLFHQTDIHTNAADLAEAEAEVEAAAEAEAEAEAVVGTGVDGRLTFLHHWSDVGFSATSRSWRKF